MTNKFGLFTFEFLFYAGIMKLEVGLNTKVEKKNEKERIQHVLEDDSL